MVSYMVFEQQWQDYCAFNTEAEAREYIEESLKNYPDSNREDYILYKRERLD